MDNRKEKGVNVKTRRVIAYVVLVLITILCLFWFYVLFINATRSNSELKHGFTMIPSSHLGENLHNIFHSSNLPILSGLINSLLIAGFTAGLCTYFSTMTAFAIHAYNFKLKKFMFTFILAVMMIPPAACVIRTASSVVGVVAKPILITS